MANNKSSTQNLGEVPLPLTWTQNDFDSLSPQKQQAYAAYIAQLRHTATLINNSLTDHPHFMDDCGDYLTAALDLSNQLTPLDGIDSILDNFEHIDLNDFASDGVVEDVIDYFRDYYPDRIDD